MLNVRFGTPSKLMPTYVIIALNIAVYAYTSVIGGDFFITGDDPIMLYGQVNYLVFEGWYWQLFTAMFVHVNIAHLAGNMFFLLIFGLRAEQLFRTREYLLIYVASGLAGNLLTLLFGPAMISAGASGAIFGVFGAVNIYIRRAIGQSIVGALLFSFFWIVISWGFGVNVLAHFGGLIAGLVIGYWLATRMRKRVIYEFNYAYER